MFGNKNQEKVAAVEAISNSSNHIGMGTVIRGDVETSGNIRIEGTLTGNITCKSKVVMGQSAKVDGNVIAQIAEVEGLITGRVEVSDVLVLKPTARIEGDILTNKMIVESGAQFNGSCQMSNVKKDEQSKTRSGVESKEGKISKPA
ncbi:polymer-forming cytoskeletal protein [Persicobacter psychrovividus]|uniref:Polymer-forming cytoskeletal protein n=1 Tax=Persicobacter psychrovividus TaxID=387638 RepID=A0ABM7VH15_9BACT|nr:hypothetical protein PEPS_25070 [Persicobacter psychrovividus]